MSTRKQPDTSRDAFKALTPEKLRTDYNKIIEALKSLGSGTYEEIATCIQCREPNVVSRRLKEMEGLEMIWKPGTKRPTKRGRSAYVYQLTEKTLPKTEKQEAEMSAPKRKLSAPISDSKPIYIPQQLFN